MELTEDAREVARVAEVVAGAQPEGGVLAPQDQYLGLPVVRKCGVLDRFQEVRYLAECCRVVPFRILIRSAGDVVPVVAVEEGSAAAHDVRQPPGVVFARALASLAAPSLAACEALRIGSPRGDVRTVRGDVLDILAAAGPVGDFRRLQLGVVLSHADDIEAQLPPVETLERVPGGIEVKWIRVEQDVVRIGFPERIRQFVEPHDYQLFPHLGERDPRRVACQVLLIRLQVCERRVRRIDRPVVVEYGKLHIVKRRPRVEGSFHERVLRPEHLPAVDCSPRPFRAIGVVIAVSPCALQVRDRAVFLAQVSLEPIKHLRLIETVVEDQVLLTDHRGDDDGPLAVVVEYLRVRFFRRVPQLVVEKDLPAVLRRHDLWMQPPVAGRLDVNVQAVRLRSVEEIVIDLVDIPEVGEAAPLGLLLNLFPCAVVVQKLTPAPESGLDVYTRLLHLREVLLQQIEVELGNAENPPAARFRLAVNREERPDHLLIALQEPGPAVEFHEGLV